MNLGPFFTGVSTFLVFIEDKVVPKASILNIIYPRRIIFLGYKGLRVLLSLFMELSSLFKFPWILRSTSFILTILGISSYIFSCLLIMWDKVISSFVSVTGGTQTRFSITLRASQKGASKKVPFISMSRINLFQEVIST